MRLFRSRQKSLKRPWIPRAQALGASISIFLIAGVAWAVTLPWSTTFNCAETDQSQPNWPNCDGLSPHGSWTALGKGEQITTAANNSNGGGGRGQREWNGDTQNVGSGSTSIDFSAVNDIYVRWYMRYQQGYSWAPLQYDKVIYFFSGAIAELYGSDSWNFHSGGTNHVLSNAGFQTANGGAKGDGKFHCYEIHQKRNPGTNDDVGELWLDGVFKGSVTGFDFSKPFDGFIIGENQNSPANGAAAYVDFDDIAIHTNGPVGCLGTGAQRPAAPGNLKLQ